MSIHSDRVLALQRLDVLAADHRGPDGDDIENISNLSVVDCEI
jgi:hypothetical protein